MRRSNWRERLNYWFDSVMARGTGALIALLAAASAAAILLISLVVAALQLYPTRLPDGYADLSLPELLWGSLTRMLSSGAFREDEGWGFRIAMLVATLCGLVLVAGLIGIVSNAFDRRVLELRRGRSRVLESGHTLIVGWNATVLPMIGELATAGAEGRRSTVVLLSRRDKVEVEEEVRAQFGRLRGIRLIVRTGSPIEPADLAMASPETARSIVVVSPEATARPDIEVIKTVVVLVRRLREHASGAALFAELRRSESLDAARLAGEGRARWVVSEEIVALLTLHSVRDRGISRLTRDLLDFARDEFLLVPAGALAGRTFADAQLSFPTATLVGLRDIAGTRLNPPGSTVLETDDTLVVIAADARSTTAGSPAPVDRSRIRDGRSRPPQPSRTLVLGSHSGLGPLLAALGQYFPIGSSTLVVTEATDVAIAAPDVALEIADTTSRAVLERLDIPSFDHVIVLPYRDALGEQEADAHSLVTVLHVRDIRDRVGADVAIVTEVLDDRNREIIGGRDDGDVIVSGLLVSRLLTQLATTPDLADVFDELFSARGSEPHLRDADEYVDLDTPVDAATLVAAAATRGETFLGILRARGPKPMTLNPPKSARVELAAGDRVIVLADQ